MKSTQKTLSLVFALLAAIAITACSSSDDAPALSPARGPVSLGVITGLSSVVVNGVTFNTTGAVVKLDDNPSAADQLKIGMVVKVRGTSDDVAGTGTATLVEAMDALEGTIQAVDAVNNTLTVMGQTVQVEDNVTRLNDDDAVKTFAAANFLVDDRVEVHAFPDDRGGLRATRVVKKTTGEFEIKGFVVSTGAGSFVLSLTPGGVINNLTVTGALPAGAVVGSFVEVKASAAPVGGAITATSVQLEDAFGPANEKAKVEGIVTSGTVDSFMVNGQRVVTTSATVFSGGLKTDFAVGVKVEAEGTINADKAIVAAKVMFRSNIKIEADASGVSASGLTVLGMPVAINAYTRIDNGPLADGQHVEVRAFPDRDGNLVAARIVVRNPDLRAFLQGPVTTADGNAGTMTILGATITTDAQTEFRASFDASEQTVTAAAFFAQVKAGVTVVKVRWANAAAAPAGVVEQAEIQMGKTLLASGESASQGVVTKLGSIFVNGVRIHTGSAAVMVDGVPAAEDNLKEGMTVNVRGTIDDATQTGTASLVMITNAMEGMIEAVDAATKTLIVMGQTVQIEDNVTRLNDDNLQKVFVDGNFAVGEHVEVHGLFDDAGKLRATRVAKKVSGEFEVKGFVTSVGTGTFGLSLIAGGAETLSVNGSLPTGAGVGSIVEVKANAAPSAGAITATLVKLEDHIGFAGEKAKVEGIVMSGAVADFTINGQRVLTDANTLFLGGLPADFVVGAKVEAEGPLDVNGAIMAVKVSFRSNIRAEANVTAVNAASLTLDIGGTVAINQYTRLDDGLPALGDHVEVRAFLDRDGNLIASRIKVLNPGPRIELQGPLTAANGVAGTMTILGAPVTAPGLGASVTTNVATIFRISSTAAEPAVPIADFFAQLKLNVTVVKVRWASIAAFNLNSPVEQAEIEIGK